MVVIETDPIVEQRVAQLNFRGKFFLDVIFLAEFFIYLESQVVAVYHNKIPRFQGCFLEVFTTDLTGQLISLAKDSEPQII